MSSPKRSSEDHTFIAPAPANNNHDGMSSSKPKEHSFVAPAPVNNNHGQGPPHKKKMLSIYEPLATGTVPTTSSSSREEEMNFKVLQVQKQKLTERLRARQRQEEEMEERIRQLEFRQTQDDAVLNVINRYWNQLNEDIGILLERFDGRCSVQELATTPSDPESEHTGEGATPFLTQLSTWDKDELDSQLAVRVQKSTKAIERIIQAFDQLQKQNENISKAIEDPSTSNLNDAIKETTSQLTQENQQLEAMNTRLHAQFRDMSLKREELEAGLEAKETHTDDLKGNVDDLEWEVQKLILSNERLMNHITELGEKYRRLQQSNAAATCSPGPSIKTEDGFLLPAPKPEVAAVKQGEVELLQRDNEELREMANSRLTELESMHHTHKETLKELERVRMEIKILPDALILETPAYKTLQSKLYVMYNESNQLRANYDEARQATSQMRSQQLKHIEHRENEELLTQKKLRTELIQIEDMICQVRGEYELLRVEFEQNITANEQTGPINREMRKLITSLQNHNQQLKGDAGRSKRRYKEMCSEMAKLKKDREYFQAKLNAYLEKDKQRRASVSHELESTTTAAAVKVEDSAKVPSADLVPPPQQSQTPIPTPTPETGEPSSGEKLEKEKPPSILLPPPPPPGDKKVEVDAMTESDLRAQLKKALSEQKEMKLVLDIYKTSKKDMRDSVQLAAAEKKARMEVEELRNYVKRIQESRQEEKKKLADVDAVKKIKALEDQLQSLQKSYTVQKTEEEALIAEMEVTGQAFEEMQEQNLRLVNQLSQKDDSNFKLMSERMKSSQQNKTAEEETVEKTAHSQDLAEKVEQQILQVRRLEDKERVCINTISAMEKESVLRMQACDTYKRKAMEAAQSSFELSLHLEKYHAQMKDAQEVVQTKTEALETQAYKTKKLQEELMGLKRKLERLNKIEQAGNCDEIMIEEIREYKETLTCPSCKVKRKDAVLTKCFHVFCFDCLRTRYETRQRKCPKCNAPFGSNDYHRLYLT